MWESPCTSPPFMRMGVALCAQSHTRSQTWTLTQQMWSTPSCFSCCCGCFFGVLTFCSGLSHYRTTHAHIPPVWLHIYSTCIHTWMCVCGCTCALNCGTTTGLRWTMILASVPYRELAYLKFSSGGVCVCVYQHVHKTNSESDGDDDRPPIAEL